MTALLKRLLVCGLGFVSTASLATDNLYGALTVGYSESDFDTNSVDSATYKFAVGYQFHPQWYLELGYQQLADETMQAALPTTMEEANNFQGGMQGDALFASILGKASGQTGELFYRLGIMKADVKGQSLVAGSQCALGEVNPVTIGDNTAYTVCEYDEGNLAGVVGIGFDYFLTARAMLRSEVEYVKGENDLQTSAVYIGIRYNF